MRWILQLAFGGPPITMSMSQYMVIQGLTATEASFLINSMTEFELALYQTRMNNGAEYALNEQIKELVDKYDVKTKSSNNTTIAIDPDEFPKLEGYPIPDPNLFGPNHTGGDQIIEKDWRDYILTADDGSSMIPVEWGEGKPNKKGDGTRWEDPSNKGNGVRIDKGNPDVSQPTQQVDHVIVRYNGQVIGRDGKPIKGSIADNAEQAHIPLSEYKKWKNWNSPK